MSAPVRCTACGHVGKVPSDYVGRRIRCRRCGEAFTAAVLAPELVLELPVRQLADESSIDQTIIEPWYADVLLPPANPQPPPEPPLELPPLQRPCPMCGEQILAIARKCKHCGEFLDSSVRPESYPIQLADVVPARALVQPAPVHIVQQERKPGFRCPFCNTDVPLLRKTKVSAGGWVFFWTTLLFLCIPLCWIGLLIRDEYQVCSQCGVKVG